MNRIPFSVYDFFGYLASGFLLVISIDYIREEQWILPNNLSIVYSLFWIIVIYIIGHIIANLSSWLLEKMIVGRWLNWSSINLFSEPPKKWWVKLFSGYFTPFPRLIHNRILERAKVDGITETGHALFIHAFGEVKKDEFAMSRLNTFLNLYGFCRNISFACLLAAIIIILGSWRLGTWDKLLWAFISFVCSIGMFYRYLKFFRQFSFDLFITYSALPSEKKKNGD